MSDRMAAKLAAIKAYLSLLGLEINYGMHTLERKGKRKARRRFSGDRIWHRAAQEATILSVVSIGLIIIVGVLIYSEVQSALPTPENSDLENASNNSTETFADTMELAPVVMIVLIAVLILTIVQRFRS